MELVELNFFLDGPARVRVFSQCARSQWHGVCGVSPGGGALVPRCVPPPPPPVSGVSKNLVSKGSVRSASRCSIRTITTAAEAVTRRPRPAPHAAAQLRQATMDTVARRPPGLPRRRPIRCAPCASADWRWVAWPPSRTRRNRPIRRSCSRYNRCQHDTIRPCRHPRRRLRPHPAQTPWPRRAAATPSPRPCC